MNLSEFSSIDWSLADAQTAIILGGIGFSLGGLIAWLWTRGYFTKRITEARNQLALCEQRLQIAEASHEQMEKSFKAMSADALRDSQESFLTLAKQALASEREVDRSDLARQQQEFDALVSPVRDSLSRVDQRISEVEKAREGAYHELRQQVSHMADTQQNLRQETGNLVKALRRPAGRGQWGEMQLRRVVELSLIHI